MKYVMKLDGQAFAERAWDLLQDRAPSVSGAARDSLRRYVSTVGRARLEDAVARSAYRHARLNALRLIPALSKWQSISALLHAAAAEDKQVASLAEKYVREWNRQYNRSQTTPSAHELEELHSALSATEPRLEQAVVEQIRFGVRTFTSG